MTSMKRTIIPTLENVPEKLRSARLVLPADFPSVILDFSEYMAKIALKKSKYNCKFTPETMWVLAFDAKDHIETQRQAVVPVPKNLQDKMPKIHKNMRSFYLLIDKISYDEFSKKFRALSSSLSDY